MEAKLAENDHKGGWEETSCEWLLRRLELEVHELETAMNWKPAEDVAREAADVANYAMMIAEQAKRGKRSGYRPKHAHSNPYGERPDNARGGSYP